MSESFGSVSGKPFQSLELHVPQSGVWFADVRMLGDDELTGKVTIAVGDTTLVGTVSQMSGTFGLQQVTRIIGGGGGWAKNLPAKHYHNDAGVKRNLVASDAARLCGETLGTLTFPSERVGSDYVRVAGPGSTALDYLAAGSSWWVGYDGATYVGTRKIASADAGQYEVLSYDPISQVVEVAVDSLSDVSIGSILSERLDSPLTVRGMTVKVNGEKFRLHCWCGGDSTSASRDRRAMEAIVKHLTGKPLLGLYKYRVFAMNADRVDLQAIDTSLGLPDLLPVAMVPGASGWHAELSKGAEVYVQFANGDRSEPVITGFPGKGQAGHTPVAVSICEGTLPLARQGDMVLSGGPTVFATFVGASPMVPGTPYVMTFTTATNPTPTPYLAGVVASGSARVKA